MAQAAERPQATEHPSVAPPAPLAAQQSTADEIFRALGGRPDAIASTSRLSNLVNDLGGDIYAIFVHTAVTTHSVLDGFKHLLHNADGDDLWQARQYRRRFTRRLVQQALILLFTAGLQMALIGLLWRAAAAGDPPVSRPETSKLWGQVGQTHQLLCRMRYSAGMKDLVPDLPEIGSPTPDGSVVDCSDFWPGSVDNSASPDPDVPDYATARKCLRQSFKDMNMSDPACRGLRLVTNENVMAYGLGLFYDNRSATTKPTAGSAQESLRIRNRRNGTTQGNNAMGGSSGWNVGETFSFISVAYILLAITVHAEVKKAARLAYVAAACTGILPDFYGLLPGGELHRVDCDVRLLKPPGWSGLLGFLVVAAPVLQWLAALATLVTASVLFLFQHSKDDFVFIVVNALALKFILEIDDVVGSLASVRPRWVLQPYHSSTSTSPLAVACLGYAYFALLGLLVFGEALLLAPQSAANLLAFVVVGFGYGQAPHAVGLMAQFFSNPHTHPSTWFGQGFWSAWSFGGWQDALQLANGELTRAYIWGAMVTYALLSVATVLLLYGRMLPAAQPSWTWALLLLQGFLVFLPQLQSMLFNRACPDPQLPIGEQAPECRYRGSWWSVVLSASLVAWLALFVVWPAVWCRRRRPSDPRASVSGASFVPAQHAAAPAPAASAESVPRAATKPAPFVCLCCDSGGVDLSSSIAAAPDKGQPAAQVDHAAASPPAGGAGSVSPFALGAAAADRMERGGSGAGATAPAVGSAGTAAAAQQQGQPSHEPA